MIRICDLSAYADRTVTFQGWAFKVQKLKSCCFLHVRDSVDGRIQVVAPTETDIAVESYIQVTGTVKQLPERARSYQKVEVHSISIVVLGLSSQEITSKCPADAGTELRLEQRHLYIRHELPALIIKMRAELLRALRATFDEMDCTEIVPSCFVGNQCEGGATLFKLKHPGASGSEDMDAYLTQSSQFALEYALPAIGDCYCIYPSFRAEKSHTRRHLTEFLHAEAEWKGILTLEDHLAKLRTLIQGILKHFTRCAGKYLQQYDAKASTKLCDRLDQLQALARDIKVMSHHEAIDYCREHGIYKDEERKVHFSYDDDIPEAAERQMIDRMGKIVFLTRFPTAHKSFYMQPDPAQPQVAWGVDACFPSVGEIIGSGVRVHDLELLKQRLKDEGLKEKDYQEYLDLRRFGPGQTSGMGLGVDRLLTWLLEQYTIRDVVTFPRYPGRITP